MAEAILKKKLSAEIQARVFRVKHEKPWFIPRAIWGWAQRRRLPGTGRWENLGTIASTQMGNVKLADNVK